MQDNIDMEPLHKLFIYRKKLVKPYIERLLKWMDGITYMMSALLILTLVYEHGFLISFEEMEVINMLYHFVWIVFLVDISLHLLLNYSDTKQKYRGLAWLLSLMLYLTLIPVIFHEPEVQGGIHDFWSFFHSRLYHVVLLTLLSLLQLSNGIVRLLGRRTNPSLIFASSFLIFILIGAALLMLPRATYHGISFIDALFTATSATCVTGLVSVDVSSTFTPEGLFIIIMLIQIGGLGVMTLTSFFAMFFMGNTSLYNQLVVRDMVSSQSLSSLLSTLLYILGFTFALLASILGGKGIILLALGIVIQQIIFIPCIIILSTVAVKNSIIKIKEGIGKERLKNSRINKNYMKVQSILSAILIIGIFIETYISPNLIKLVITK